MFENIEKEEKKEMADGLQLYAGNRAFNILKKKHYDSCEKVAYHFPRLYRDYTTPAELMPLNCEQDLAFVCTLICDRPEVLKRNGRYIVKTAAREVKTGKKLNISWFGQYFMKQTLERSFGLGDKIIVSGKVSYNAMYNSFNITNPISFEHYDEKRLKIVPVYTKHRGISEEKMEELIEFSLRNVSIKDMLSQEFKKAYGLPDLRWAVREKHYPESLYALQKAGQRLDTEDMFYFALKLEVSGRRLPIGSSYNIRSLKNTYDFIENLPYELTTDQRKSFDEMIALIRQGKRLNALIQGDVGCGKTITAFLMMFAMADSGYQSLIVAPTGVLAKQHYNELSGYAEKYGYKVVLMSGDMKAAEKKKVLAMIASGEADMIVGTHSVLSKNVIFNNLALSVVDEEHKFGVIQRESITQKAKAGIHTITMSATPIPRTLAATLFSANVQVYEIKSMPNGRKPVKTTIFSKESGIFAFAEKEMKAGRQVYVVCPLIAENEAEEEQEVKDITLIPKEPVLSVEETYARYQDYFNPVMNKDENGEEIRQERYPIGILNGKMKPQEMRDAIDRFSKGETKILISTTVVEVGVNVPNASVIIINNAERFGLAGLHQLRGRVGRGKDQGYCILNSTYADNARLNALCEHTSGFEIAEEDLRIRGTGDLTGTEQSGENHYIDLAVKYPNVFKALKAEAERYCDMYDAEDYFTEYEKYH